MPSSRSQTATHVAPHSSAAELWATPQDAPSEASPGLVRRALLKLIGSAESLVRGQGNAAGSDRSTRPDARNYPPPSPERVLAVNSAAYTNVEALHR